MFATLTPGLQSPSYLLNNTFDAHPVPLKKLLLAALLLGLPLARANAQAPKMDRLFYGVAYYDEYMPYDRLDKDVAMMKAAGINVVRIAESTWSTLEPQEGKFDFSHVDRVLDAMHKGGIRVIIGTPSPTAGRISMARARTWTSATPTTGATPRP
jgi:beta-galactosidase GanA